MSKLRCGDWISVDDMLPKPNQRVFIAPSADVAHYDDAGWLSPDNHCRFHGVTHWTPIPEPPKQEKKSVPEQLDGLLDKASQLKSEEEIIVFVKSLSRSEMLTVITSLLRDAIAMRSFLCWLEKRQTLR